MSLRIVRPRVDLPHPDSPTIPSVSPSSTVKLTPSTALTTPLLRENRPSPIGKCFFRSRISKRLMVLTKSQRSDIRDQQEKKDSDLTSDIRPLTSDICLLSSSRKIAS